MVPESYHLAMLGMTHSNPKAKVSFHSPFLCSWRPFLEMSKDQNLPGHRYVAANLRQRGGQPSS